MLKPWTDLTPSNNCMLFSHLHYSSIFYSWWHCLVVLLLHYVMYMFIYVERFSWNICFLWICDLSVLDKVSVLAWKNSEKCFTRKNVKSTFSFEKKQFSDWILSIKTVCDNIYDWDRKSLAERSKWEM